MQSLRDIPDKSKQIISGIARDTEWEVGRLDLGMGVEGRLFESPHDLRHLFLKIHFIDKLNKFIFQV